MHKNVFIVVVNFISVKTTIVCVVVNSINFVISAEEFMKCNYCPLNIT